MARTAQSWRFAGETVSIRVRRLYQSENGDRWYLVHDLGSGRVFVRHQPNLPSGGQPSDIELGAFLARGAAGPEHQELIRLIGTLAHDPQDD
jgi:hypothetical protein